MKKTYVTLIILIIGFGNTLFAQATKLYEPFQLLAPFEIFRGNIDEPGRQYFLALGKYNDTYLLLMENIVNNDYSMSYKTFDTSLIRLELEFYSLGKINSTSYAAKDFVILKPFKYQPNSNTTGNVIAFKLPDEYAYDIKNKYLSSIKIEGSTIPVKSNLKEYFIKNASKLKSIKGSYVDIEQFQNNTIPVYSLLLKNKSEIRNKLGQYNNVFISKDNIKKYKNDSVFTYKSKYGEYEVSFKGDIAYRIIFEPTIKIQGSSGYLLKEYLQNKFPFDVYPNKSLDYTFKEGYSASGKFDYSESLNFFFKNDIQHNVRLDSKGRFVTKAQAIVEKDNTLLTITKTDKEKILEEIKNGKEFSPKEVCKLNGIEYSESIYTVIRNSLKQRIPQTHIDNCMSNNYSVDFQIIIKWNKYGRPWVKYKLINGNCEQIAKKITDKLEDILKFIKAPRVYDTYVDCVDTLQISFSDIKLKFYADEQQYKFSEQTPREIKEFILNNKEKHGFQYGNIYEVKVIQSHYENEKFLVQIIVLTNSAVSRKERKSIVDEFRY